MAVYTKINNSDILNINKIFPLEKITSFIGIKKGIENTNYLLKTKKTKYILTIFEKRVANKDVPFFMKLMDLLNSAKINCPKPIKNLENKYLFKIKGKLACIVTFLDGKDKKILTTKNCYQVGTILAKMHQITKRFKIKRENSMGMKNMPKLLESINFKKIKFAKNINKDLKKSFVEIKKNWPKNLPKGIIHGDLFIDNIFFKKNKISGIIDFYFASNEFYMYEVAICINALCFDVKKNQFKINKHKVNSLLKGYEKVRKFTSNEKKYLNILCLGSAFRYLLTRLYDFSNTPKTALIKIKDPREYYQKLLAHTQLKTFRDYLN
jgi:homoserine kinase type II